MKKIYPVTLLVILALLIGWIPARAAIPVEITVTTVTDIINGSCATILPSNLPGADLKVSLREAICASNNDDPPNLIKFNITGCLDGYCSIYPTSSLPPLNGDSSIVIDGYTQPDASEATDTEPADVRILIIGSPAFASHGITILSDNNTVRGLAVKMFPGDGIIIDGVGATGNKITGNYIGFQWIGALPEGNGLFGVILTNGASSNIIGGDTAAERNVISANGTYGDGWGGVGIYGTLTHDNTVSGNYIGTNPEGTASVGNRLEGIKIYGGAHDNTIGGTTSGERNIISGNQGNGVNIAGSGSINNLVMGNYIGLNAAGNASLANGLDGVRITNGAQSNLIGGDTSTERNIISGNTTGISILGTTTISNTVSGNFIGLNPAGISALSNGDGIIIQDGSHNVIGGPLTGERNVIAGNDANGVTIFGSKAEDNTVVGNFIGMEAIGNFEVPNGADGIYIGSSAKGNTIGPGNVISGNDSNGVELGGYSTDTTIIGNLIGTNASGTASVGNYIAGISITRAYTNTVGGTTLAERNIISGNDTYGVFLDENSHGNLLTGNYIGLNSAGTEPVYNFIQGISLHGGSHHNIIGGSTPEERNIITGHGYAAILLVDPGTDYNLIQNNYIGTGPDGTENMNYGMLGIDISYGPKHNTISGGIIAYSVVAGVSIYDSDTYDNQILGGSIHDNGDEESNPDEEEIHIDGDANNNIGAPGIMSADIEGGQIVIRGKSFPGGTIQIYANHANERQGEIYLGDCVTDGSGFFACNTHFIPGPYLTATATETGRGTSEFSSVFESHLHFTFLPLILR